jgi:acyl carrier protein
MTKQEIFDELKEIEESAVTGDALIGDDLDLDSIDAIDLIVEMKKFAPEGKANIDQSIFKSVKTVQDVVDALANIWG